MLARDGRRAGRAPWGTGVGGAATAGETGLAGVLDARGRSCRALMFGRPLLCARLAIGSSLVHALSRLDKLG